MESAVNCDIHALRPRFAEEYIKTQRMPCTDDELYEEEERYLEEPPKIYTNMTETTYDSGRRLVPSLRFEEPKSRDTIPDPSCKIPEADSPQSTIHRSCPSQPVSICTSTIHISYSPHSPFFCNPTASSCPSDHFSVHDGLNPRRNH